MLLPKRVKHRKTHRGRRTGVAIRGSEIAFGQFGLQAVEDCYMSNRQIEAARRAMTRHVKRGGKIWIRVFPDHVITKKPAETRMGSGKGQPSGWPLPLPMRVSAGFLVMTWSGKTLIQILPPRLTWRVMARRAASIWRLVIQHTPIACSP